LGFIVFPDLRQSKVSGKMNSLTSMAIVYNATSCDLLSTDGFIVQPTAENSDAVHCHPLQPRDDGAPGAVGLDKHGLMWGIAKPLGPSPLSASSAVMSEVSLPTTLPDSERVWAVCIQKKLREFRKRRRSI
jgi:hypothetical protein